jgi:Rrf2 family transcriptional regulator, iron-sulfur cluster assembly transcription factor
MCRTRHFPCWKAPGSAGINGAVLDRVVSGIYTLSYEFGLHCGVFLLVVCRIEENALGHKKEPSIMKLSTRSRYGLRMVLDMVQHGRESPVQIGSIAKRQDVSVKYLEQLIIPLKKANYIHSVRGPKGGHLLSKPPDEITVGEIVELLEGGINLADCIANPDLCERHEECVTRAIWEEATDAMHDRLHSITLLEMTQKIRGKDLKKRTGKQKTHPQKDTT